MADCTGCKELTAVLGYGSTVEALDPKTSQWVLICGITNFSGPSSSRGEIEVTTLCSTAKEYVLDLKDFGTLEMSGQLFDGDVGQQLLDELFNSSEKTKFRLTLADDGYGNGAVVRTFDARVQNLPITVAQGAVNQVTFTLRITGDVTTERPTALGPRLVFTPAVLQESQANDGTIAGVTSVVLSGDTFSGTDGDPQAGITFTGVPSGLTANTQKINDSTVIISFTGAASVHTPGTSATVNVAFADAAFDVGPASAISGSTGRRITINFV